MKTVYFVIKSRKAFIFLHNNFKKEDSMVEKNIATDIKVEENISMIKITCTPIEAARLIRVSVNEIYNLLHENKIPHIKRGREFKIPIDTLREFINTEAWENCIYDRPGKR